MLRRDRNQGGTKFGPRARELLSALVWLAFTSGCSLHTDTGELQDVESYEHVRPAWSPDGRLIAFSGSVEGVHGIHVVDTAGSDVRCVAEGEGIGVSWSPDGEWMAFSEARQIYKIRSTGDSLVRLSTRSGAIRPAWSPGGDTIAFVRNGISLFDLSSGQESELLTFGDFPSWLPGGTGIVFLTAMSMVDGIRYSFESCELPGRHVSTLFEFRSLLSCGFCSISPAGDAIVFSGKDFGRPAQIWVADLTGGGITRLTGDGGDYPAWSPDGARIVYTRTASGDGALWIMNADGSGKRRLTSPK